MSLLEVVPDTKPLLRRTSRRVKHVDDKLRQLVADMYETMVKNWGAGLAAIQVGVRKRLFIYEILQREVKGYDTCHAAPTSEEDGEGAVEGADEETASSHDTGEQEPEVGGYTGEYTVCINPRIVAREGAYIDDEGCLSKDGWIAKVERAYKVTFQAYDINMEKFERAVEGLEARCVQHEIDHLDGILFTDRAIPDTLREIKEEEEEPDGEHPPKEGPPKVEAAREETTTAEPVEVEGIVGAGEH